MFVIDADAHVVETEHTWDYMDASDAQFRPIVVDTPDQSRANASRSWFIDGKVRTRAGGIPTSQNAPELSGRKMLTPREAREMENVPARLRHMDELGIDIQVLYPTMFLRKIADRPEAEVAVCRAYNRWMAEIWKKGQGRLRWAVVIPSQVIEEALIEVRTGVQRGACAVMMRSIEGDRAFNDPYFPPLYEEASRLNIPIAVHVGNANPLLADLLGRYGGGRNFAKLRLMSVAAFHALVLTGVPSMFPKLRFGFLEASSQWVPFVIHDLVRRAESRGELMDSHILQNNRLYVACQTDDDIPYVARYAGEDHLLLGTDYGHADQSSEIDAFRNLEKISGLDPSIVEKIVYHNPKAFYNL